jgi:hypothetical protein
MNKKKILKTALIPGIGLALIGIASASAMSFGPMNITPQDMATRQATMFQNQANILGLSTDDIKNAWASGTDLKTLAKQKGISLDTVKQKMQAQRLDAQKTMLATLVSNGVITQAQSDQRLATITAQIASGKTGGRHGMRGFGMMGW